MPETLIVQQTGKKAIWYFIKNIDSLCKCITNLWRLPTKDKKISLSWPIQHVLTVQIIEKCKIKRFEK